MVHWLCHKVSLAFRAAAWRHTWHVRSQPVIILIGLFWWLLDCHVGVMKYPVKPSGCYSICFYLAIDLQMFCLHTIIFLSKVESNTFQKPNWTSKCHVKSKDIQCKYLSQSCFLIRQVMALWFEHPQFESSCGALFHIFTLAIKTYKCSHWHNAPCFFPLKVTAGNEINT